MQEDAKIISSSSSSKHISAILLSRDYGSWCNKFVCSKSASNSAATRQHLQPVAEMLQIVLAASRQHLCSNCYNGVWPNAMPKPRQCRQLVKCETYRSRKWLNSRMQSDGGPIAVAFRQGGPDNPAHLLNYPMSALVYNQFEQIRLITGYRYEIYQPRHMHSDYGIQLHSKCMAKAQMIPVCNKRNSKQETALIWLELHEDWRL